MTERVASACRLCAVGCGTIVELDGDRVVGVAGDPQDPWSAGYTCSKGRAGATFHHHPDRFDVPLVRRGGELVACSWDEALDDIASRLAGAKLGVGVGNFYAYRLLQALGIDTDDGAVRVSFVHYTAKDEVDRLTRELERCSS